MQKHLRAQNWEDTLRRQAFRLVPLLAAACLGLLVPSAQAHEDIYGWRDCDQQLSLSGSTLRIGTDPSAPFPASSVRDGVQNSFNDRIVDATNYWSTVIDPYTSYGLQWVGTNSPEIPIRYVELAQPYSGVTSRSTSCKVHAPGYQYGLLSISIDIGTNWFTQDNSRRQYWESCATSNDGSYTCSRTNDFQSVVTHELGHALGLGHPESVDSHLGSNRYDASNAAKCFSTTDDATMCSAYTPYRTTFRTLDPWDVESLRRQYTY